MITELNKYTFAEFIALPPDERDLYKAFGLRLKGLNPTEKPPAPAVPMLDWEWAKVKQLQDIINQESLTYDDLVEVLVIATGKKRDEVMAMAWTDFFPIYNFIAAEIKVINEKEQALAYEPDAREMNAGVDQYHQFGWFATLNRLAGGDPLKYDAIGQQPYSVIFSTLLLQKTDREFEKALIRQNTASHV